MTMFLSILAEVEQFHSGDGVQPGSMAGGVLWWLFLLFIVLGSLYVGVKYMSKG